MLFRFGPFALDSDRLHLSREGVELSLEPKPLAVLVHLLERHPVVVDREELLAVVWPGVQVTSASLSRAVRGLRRALGEQADGDSVIRTARGRGYAMAVPVSRESQGHVPTRSGAKAPPRPLLGREDPIASLADALTRASANRGSVCTVVGEPGIGKTRVGEAVAERARAAGWTVLAGRCFGEARAPALAPWTQILRGAREALGPNDFEHALGDHRAELARLLSELATVQPLHPTPADDAPWSDGSGQPRFRLLEAIDHTLHSLSRSQPLLVWLDDLHQADRSSLDVFEHVAARSSGRALVLLACHRPAEDDTLAPVLERLASLPDARPPVRLDGLSSTALAELAEAEAGFTLSGTQRTSLHRRTGGNPFFAIELVRAGALAPRDGARVVSGPEGVPERIRAVVRHRVQALAPATRELLQIAAVLGDDLRLAVLARALGRPEETLLEALEEAEKADLLREQDSGSFAFQHALVSEALYEGLSRGDRARLHGQLAPALEALHGDASGPHVAAVAHHYGRAVGQTEKAVDWAMRAGADAHGRLAFADAADHYARAIGWLEERSERSSRVLALAHGAHARALMALGRPEDAEEAAWSALAHAREAASPRLLATVAWPLTASRFRGRGGERVAEALEEGLLAVGDDIRSEALLSAMLARAISYTGDFERIDALSTRALELARQSRDPEVELRALFTRDLVLVGDARRSERRSVNRDRLGLALELRNPREEYFARLYSAIRLLEEGQGAELDKEIDQLSRLCGELHDELRYDALRSDLLALRAIWRGQAAEAEAALPDLRALWSRVDPLYGMMSLAAKQQLIDFLLGRRTEVTDEEISGARGPSGWPCHGRINARWRCA